MKGLIESEGIAASRYSGTFSISGLGVDAAGDGGRSVIGGTTVV